MSRAHKAWLTGVFDRAAATYDRVGHAYHDALGRRLLEVAEPPVGYALLDVACGRGAVLAAADGAARRVGIDVSAAMIAEALARVETGTGAHGAAPAGVEVELRVMDAERLDFPDGTFDVVTCAFAVFFLPKPDCAVAGFRRVLRPGGLVALASWGEEDPRWAWEGHLFGGVGVRRRAVRQPFERPDELESLLAGAGFERIRLHREELEIRFADADQWWDWNWSFSRRGLLEQLDTATVAAMRAGCTGHLEAMRTPDGIPMRLVAWFAVGCAPADGADAPAGGAGAPAAGGAEG